MCKKLPEIKKGEGGPTQELHQHNSVVRQICPVNSVIACDQVHLWVTRASDLRAKRSGGQDSGAEAPR